MDAFVFGVVVCLVIGVIALLVKIFNRGKSLPPATTEECFDVVQTLLTKPEYDDIPGNIHFDEFRNHTGHMM